MTGAVFYETLRRSWRGMLWWGIGLGFAAFVNIIAVPNVESIQQIAELMETMPPIFLQMFGAGDVSFYATPEGYLALQLFAFFPLLLAVYAAVCGLNVVSNDEDRRIIDMPLSLPLERWRLVAEKSLAYMLLILGVVTLLFVWIWISLLLVPEILAEVDMGEMALASFGMTPLTWIVMGFTVLVTGLLRRRGLAIALVAMFVMISYFLDALGSAAPDTILATLKPLAYFSHLDSQAILQGAADWTGLFAVTIATVIFVAGGIFFFQRRDVGI
jgi:ABC-type transport system involved in multi-copper enzyme maturation permease subunit